MQSTQGIVAYGLTLFMLVGGIYNLVIAQIFWGGSVWILTALLLLPPLQDILADYTGYRIPAQFSLLIFIGGFVLGVFLP